MNEKDFEKIAAIIDEKLDKKLAPVLEAIDELKEAVDELKEEEMITRTIVNELLAWTEYASVTTKVDFPLPKVK